MNKQLQKEVELAICSYQDPYLKTDYLTNQNIVSLNIKDDKVFIVLVLPYPVDQVMEKLKQGLIESILLIDAIKYVNIDMSWRIKTMPVQEKLNVLPSIKNVIAIASGKGGVGKSTTSVNIALALASQGAKVGLLDADIYGPSVGLMLGIADEIKPNITEDKKFEPIKAHGIEAMSMAFLANENTPMVWRGPMVSGALIQLMMQTDWHDLDYLIIDMPPGTGDIPLTLAQKIPVSGALIITTPQDLALIDAKKSIEMFNKVNISVLGVVENMATHVCSHCGHAEPIFGQGGGQKLANESEVNLLASLPLSMTIRECIDKGAPSVIADKNQSISQIYQQVALELSALLSMKGQQNSSIAIKNL